MNTPFPISVIATWIDAHGAHTGRMSFGVEVLDEIAPRLNERPLGTVRITLDIALPQTIAPCQWTDRQTGGRCGIPSVVTREIALVLDTLDIGSPRARPECGPWRELDLCFTHYSEAQTHQTHGTLLMRLLP